MVQKKSFPKNKTYTRIDNYGEKIDRKENYIQKGKKKKQK